MVGATQAALLGAAFAQTWPTLISLWTFDETSDAGGVFGDLGPANVPMDIVGTWADLSTDSMVQEIGGTSAYTDGSGYATIPANDPDHDLAELTISFYYQRNSAAAKHVLLAASDALSTGAGDFSIEVLPNGRLRAFHVGQDAQLRFFESTDGITGTNLQVGSAHRIDLTLGALGARIYLDGAPLTNAFILANTNGWNNARTKYLGRWIDGVEGPADGAFDGLRIWDRQLTSAQIATLEPAQSITLPGAPQELPVPSLAEWLKSDEADGSITKYVSNVNRGNGTGSSPENAQEVQAALNGASGGQVLLAVCQTPGAIEHWNYPSGLTFPSGTSHTNRVTLKARQGDGVVINAGQEFGGSRTSGFWTQSGLSADDISKKIWRSVDTFTGGAQAVMGVWIEFDQPHQLISAGNMTNLRAPYGTGNSPDNYSGPMVYKDSDNRVYIRFQRPHPGKYSAGNKWSVETWPGHPEAVSGGQLVYPISENPNDYVIHLFRVSSVNSAFKTGQWIKVGPGINSVGYRDVIDQSNTWIDRGTHISWRFGIRPPSSSSDFRTNIFCHRARFSDGCKLHVSRDEWKFGGWLEGGFRSAWLLMNASNAMSDIYCLDCTISDWHEIGVSGFHNLNQMRFRNCTFKNIYDDGFQMLMTTSRCEIGYCYFYNSAYGGFGENISESPGDANPGGWFIHHNIMDARQERCTDWRAQAHPGALYIPHSPDNNRPERKYNNLFIWGPDIENEFGIGMEHSSQGDGGNNTSSVMHECFNNILLRVFLEGTKRYDPAGDGVAVRYSDSFAESRTDFVLGVLTLYSATESNELFDYNCYWRSASMSVDGLFRGHRRGGIGQTTFNFASLAAWHAHAEFEHSKLSGVRRGAYAPGFDGNSTDSKPTLPSIDDYPNSRLNYRPSPTSVVTTATTSSLSGVNWWTTPPTWGATYFSWNDGARTLAPSPWKGALDPNGTTMIVGVQNP
jgi:hypothetical protein